ncbi:MAG: FAD-dependent oxidoreductase [Thermodesulfobacteriota bacterium]|nr:FAD-dependent oxidoreductase [Thermodesulfobacteriota bacterium]
MERLFQPISINSLKLKNRILMPTLDPGFAGEGGKVNQRLIDYFVRRARGGVSFIMVGPAVFDPRGVGGTFEYRLYLDGVLEGLSRLVEAIHHCGVPVGLQLHHAGRQANPELIEGPPVAPSAIPCPVRKSTPRTLTIPEIEEIVLQYGNYARKIKEAGFDAVEIHGSHGYLIAGFLSPLANSRTDQYGGSLANRARFAQEVVREVRRSVGNRFPVFFRIAGEEHVPGGLTKEETPLIAKLAEEAGVDAIDVSAGNYQTAEWIVPPMTLPQGCNIPAAEAIKQKVKIPVVVSGRINEPELAEQILQNGKADIVAIARGLVADPDLPLKVQEGKLEEIRRCIACNVCIDRLFQEKDIVCTVNPEAGREAEFELKPTLSRKRVMVIGGGPAGMEAARVAKLRGHQVSIFEEKSRLGGRIEAAFQASFKRELTNIVQYYEAVLKALNVEIKLATKVTMNLALGWKPDAVIIATGSIPLTPPIPGVNLPHVVQALPVLLQEKKVEGRVAIIGGGMVGCEVATFLAERGAQVTIIEMLPYVAKGIPRLLGKMMKDTMKNLKVRTLIHSQVVEIKKGEVVYEDGQKRASLPVDWVVLAVGALPRDDLIKPLKDLFREIYQIGDCLEPRKALEAIYEGAKVAHQL